jgi:hypothetical protein
MTGTSPVMTEPLFDIVDRKDAPAPGVAAIYRPVTTFPQTSV